MRLPSLPSGGRMKCLRWRGAALLALGLAAFAATRWAWVVSWCPPAYRHIADLWSLRLPPDWLLQTHQQCGPSRWDGPRMRTWMHCGAGRPSIDARADDPRVDLLASYPLPIDCLLIDEGGFTARDYRRVAALGIPRLTLYGGAATGWPKPVNDDGLIALTRNRRLTTLGVYNGSRLTSRAAAALAASPTLRSLDLISFPDFTAEDFRALLRAPALTSLEIGNAPGLNDDAFAGNAPSRLFSLKIHATIPRFPASTPLAITDRGLALLGGGAFPGLTELALDGLPPTVTARGIGTMLAGAKRLDWLRLSNSPTLDDEVVRAIVEARPTLARLGLSDMPGLTGEGLAALRGLPNLEELHLENNPGVDDATLAVLATLPLRILNVRGCVNITDAGLAPLNSATALQELFLSNCPRVTDAGLATLAARGGFMWFQLEVTGTAVTPAGVAAFTAAQPGAAVENRYLREFP